MQKNSFERTLILIIVCGFLFGGLFSLGGAVAGTLEAVNSRSWPSVTGQVIASQLVEITPVPDSPDSQPAQGESMFSVDIQYTYQAGGKSYTGSQVTLSDYSSAQRADVEHLLARYPAGSSVPVYYDPRNPASSVLEPGFASGMWVPLATGLLFTLFGVAIGAWYLRTQRRIRATEVKPSTNPA